jgi:hypothetical protein
MLVVWASVCNARERQKGHVMSSQEDTNEQRRLHHPTHCTLQRGRKLSKAHEKALDIKQEKLLGNE